MNYKKAILALAIVGTVGYAGKSALKDTKADLIALNNKVVVESSRGTEILEELKKSNDLKEEVIDEIIDVCYKKKRELNKGVAAKEHFQNPYQVEYVIKKLNGKAAGYLIDTNSGIAYPLYEGMQLGSLEHRIAGLKRIAEKKIAEGLEEARKALDDALEYVIDVVNDKKGKNEDE